MDVVSGVGTREASEPRAPVRRRSRTDAVLSVRFGLEGAEEASKGLEGHTNDRETRAIG
jgi:hypothetical protein